MTVAPPLARWRLRYPSWRSITWCALVGVALLVPVSAWLIFGALPDVGDGVNHYLGAHLAFAHPQFLLDPWFKPLFTLLAAPFAWFGFPGMVVFQAVVLLLSATMLWKIATARGLRFRWVAPLLLLVAPSTARALLSGLTEPLFGLLLVTALWSCERERWGWGYLLVGSCAFVRAEGWVLMLWWGLLALRERRWWLLVALSCGHLVYAAVGALWIVHDPLWMFHLNPYWISERAYGHGTWKHFFRDYPFVAGAPFATATVLAAMLLSIRCALARIRHARGAGDADSASDERWLLFYLGSFAAYFFAHVVFWRFGLFNSFGLPRVFVAILPVAAIVVAREWDLLVRRASPIVATLLTWTLAMALLSFALGDGATALRFHDLLTRREQQLAIDQAVARLRTVYATPGETPPVYFSSPYVAFALDLDIMDQAFARSIKELTEGPPRPGALVVWDSWFSVVEQGVTREALDRLPLDDRQVFVADGSSGERYEVVTGRVSGQASEPQVSASPR
jgi:hypothetical protein